MNRAVVFSMASPARAAVAKREKPSEPENYDPTLDFYSEKFDPLKALKTPGIQPPIINARVHDNISKYETSCKSTQETDEPRKQQPAPSTAEGASTSERRWLPHQLPITRERPVRKNLLTNMEDVEGPLMLLKKCKDERLQIKVWTRHSHGVRGYCIAYVTAFDKHWNMSLEDVSEVWTRPKRRKLPALSDQSHQAPVRVKIKIPEIKIVKADKKTETCERHVPQLLVRGEQIAFISMLP